MASTSEANADFGEVSPTFLRALSLMKVTSEETIVTSVALSKSRGTNTDKNVGGSHTSASKELKRRHKKRFKTKSVVASSTAEKSSVVKKEHLSKPEDRAKKRSYATSFDESQNIPVIVVKKTRKPAAPATDKPITKKQQHKASPPATEVSSSTPKSTVETAENFSELTSAADEGCFWDDILASDFKSMKYTTLLKNNQFTEEQVQAIQKSFQHLSRMFCRRPKKEERFMKTHECIECNYSVSHECVSIDSTEFWSFGGNVPYIEWITPEAITMCRCNFTIFHSHNLNLKSNCKAGSSVRTSLQSTLPLRENNRSANLGCSKCFLDIRITNGSNDACFSMMNFISGEGPIRKKFMRYVNDHLDFKPGNHPLMSEYFSCKNLCCILFHRCAESDFHCMSVPKQTHRTSCSDPSKQMLSV